MDKITDYILNEDKELQEQETVPAHVIQAAADAGQIGPAKYVTGVDIDLDESPPLQPRSPEPLKRR